MYRFLKGKLKKKLESFVERIVTEKLDEEFDTRLQIHKQMEEFENAPPEMLASKIESKTSIPGLIRQFIKLGIPVKEERIDIHDFIQWREKYKEIIIFYGDFKEVKVEKTLEHYLTMKYLDIYSKKVLIDVAASNSLFANIVSRHLNIKGYKLDIVYEPGIHGEKIGGDAGHMPVPDEFADILTLHCAFECFQGDADTRFVKEAGRVLTGGGCLGIVPLYLDDEYFVKVGPKYDKRKVEIEKGVRQVWRDDAYDTVPFSRHYSPASLKKRVIDNMGDLKYEIIHFTNLSDLEKHFPGQRLYAYFLLKAVKS
jgi:SAM-dependent methyltransferase